MSTALVYPSALPPPLIGVVTPAERRLLTDMQGVRKVSSLQIDYLGSHTATWALKSSEASAFQAWWSITLFMGGAWFSAAWPLPTGITSAVRKFTAPPAWQYLGRGNWRVTATLEIRGTGLAPMAY